jgi:transposase
VYYPPYHSKYNLIERCWGILEQHWNGTLGIARKIISSWFAILALLHLRSIK